MAGPPPFWARTLRQHSGIGETCPVNLEQLMEWCGIHFAEVDVKGFLGLHMCVSGQHGIMIKEGQSPGQRRFTIAHELGHFAIPDHADVGMRHCLEEDLTGVRVQAEVEREANEFAAELLMPRRVFLQDIQFKLPSFGTIKKLAAPTRYDVSMTACALRWIELAEQGCALVCIEGGRIKWKYGAKKFRYALPPRGSNVPPETAAAAVLRGELVVDGLEAIPTWAWLEPRESTREVHESTFHIPSLDQVLSIIVVGEEDRDEDDET
jgi:hypothetical protein